MQEIDLISNPYMRLTFRPNHIGLGLVTGREGNQDGCEVWVMTVFLPFFAFTILLSD